MVLFKEGNKDTGVQQKLELSSGQWGRLTIAGLTMFFSSRDKSPFGTKLGHFEGVLTLGPKKYHIKLMFTHLLKLLQSLRD